VKIPNGVAGIRGTIYTLSADGVLTVVSGSVVLSYVAPDGSVITQVVGSGQRYDAKTGEISNAPEAILRELAQYVGELRGVSFAGPTTFTVDRTLYYVSPTIGLE
jgi:hypothetical protein